MPGSPKRSPRRGNRSPNNRSPRAHGIDDALQGADALAALALLVGKAFLSQRSLQRFSEVEDLPTFIDAVQRFLDSAFQGEPWPRLYITSELVDSPQFDGLVNLVLDGTKAEHQVEGKDVITSAVEFLINKKLEDRRVLRFFEHISNFIAADLPENPQEAEEGEAYDDEDEGDDEEGGYDDTGINVLTLEEIHMSPAMVGEAQSAWTEFCRSAVSQQAAGELIYGALFESAPTLQNLFVTPRAVQAVRFMNGLANFVNALGEPKKLKALVEALGFGHLHLDVTVPRICMFRDALLDLFYNELGAGFTEDAQTAWKDMLNYVGGAIIFCRTNYAERLQILLTSWQQANDRGSDQAKEREGNDEDGAGRLASGDIGALGSMEFGGDGASKGPGRFRKLFARQKDTRARASSSGDSLDVPENILGQSGKGESPRGGKEGRSVMDAQYVPKTFEEMFRWSAGVTGVRSKDWHTEVLNSFDTIVRNVANSSRLQEECHQLSLRISKCSVGGPAVELGEFKNLMLAALRSLLPKVWDSSYEVAWTWLWDNVDRLLRDSLNTPPVWEAELQNTLDSMEEEQLYDMRRRTYERFFLLCPGGQDYFKQSDTRLHYIASQVTEMTLQIFQDPWRVIEEISALGLRHVGYGIPTEHFGPFVTAAVETFSTVTDSDTAQEAFRWSLGLISKILVRTILEGSTIVMKAVNANSEKLLKKAIACAPRAQRADWMLNIQVGTQKISPLSWAIESGNLDAASAILKDLLTIRADRERYYYGADALFMRHEDIVGRLVDEARTLLPTLFEGLVWRSRHTKEGWRRVNYYVQHLIVNSSGEVAEALGALTASKDQTIISHPVISLVSDTLWTGVVRRQFILSKLGFLFSLFVFMLSQAILPKTGAEEHREVRIAIFIGRIVNYSFSMTRLIVFHTRRWCAGYRSGKTMKVWCFKLPRYLRDFYMALGFILTLLLVAMCTHEPMFWCIGSGQWPTEICDMSADVETRYTVMSMTAMLVHWLLLIDMAVFATKLSAFVLVVKHVLSEVGRFCFAMCFLLITFGSAITCLKHDKREFRDVPNAANCLFAITVGLYEGDFREYFDAPYLLVSVFLFVTVSVIILINLLIAQLNCSYEYVYADMVGFARLTRAQLIVDSLRSCQPERWDRFTTTLRFDQKVEFDEGDIGLAGAIQVKEPASLNPVLVDRIIRYGGTCDGDMQWPADSTQDEEERFEKLERMMQAALKKLTGIRSGGDRPGSKSGGDSSTFSGGRQESGGSGGTERDVKSHESEASQ